PTCGNIRPSSPSTHRDGCGRPRPLPWQRQPPTILLASQLEDHRAAVLRYEPAATRSDHDLGLPYYTVHEPSETGRRVTQWRLCAIDGFIGHRWGLRWHGTGAGGRNRSSTSCRTI